MLVGPAMLSDYQLQLYIYWIVVIHLGIVSTFSSAPAPVQQFCELSDVLDLDQCAGLWVVVVTHSVIVLNVGLYIGILDYNK